MLSIISDSKLGIWLCSQPRIDLNSQSNFYDVLTISYKYLSNTLSTLSTKQHALNTIYMLVSPLCTKNGRPVAEVLREKHLDMRVPPAENPACAALEKYGDVPETVPLNFTEDDVTWFASKLSGAAGTLGAEAMELRNWLLRFGCVS